MKKLILFTLIMGVLSSCTRNYCYTSYEQARAQMKSKRQHLKIMKRKFGYKPYKRR